MNDGVVGHSALPRVDEVISIALQISTLGRGDDWPVARRFSPRCLYPEAADRGLKHRATQEIHRDFGCGSHAAL